MTIKELKKAEGYEFECNISQEYESTDSCDEWGCAFVWLGESIGVEYNFCIDNSTNERINSSAIYKMELNTDSGYMETDSSMFVHYEIDFSDDDWNEKLENALCEALIEFFSL